ncbi:MAG TPA: hypothetical protein VF085_11635 [Solirubrobacterales bacterium]
MKPPPCTNTTTGAPLAFSSGSYTSSVCRRSLPYARSRDSLTRERLAAVQGVELLHEAPVARELALRLEAPVDRVLDRCAERGIAAGYPLGREYPEYEDGLLVAITERRTREQIDDLAEALGAAIASEPGALVGNSATNAPGGS